MGSQQVNLDQGTRSTSLKNDSAGTAVHSAGGGDSFKHVQALTYRRQFWYILLPFSPQPPQGPYRASLNHRIFRFSPFACPKRPKGQVSCRWSPQEYSAVKGPSSPPAEPVSLSLLSSLWTWWVVCMWLEIFCETSEHNQGQPHCRGLTDLEEGGSRGGRRGYLERGGLCSCPGGSLSSTCPPGGATFALPSYQDSGAEEIMGETTPYILQGTSTVSAF